MSTKTDFPMNPLDSLKLSLMNCAFFHRPPLPLRQTSELLERDGDFLVQVFSSNKCLETKIRFLKDFKDKQLMLSVRVYGKVLEFAISIVVVRQIFSIMSDSIFWHESKTHYYKKEKTYFFQKICTSDNEINVFNLLKLYNFIKFLFRDFRGLIIMKKHENKKVSII